MGTQQEGKLHTYFYKWWLVSVKRRENTRGLCGSRAKNLPYSSERLQSSSLCFTAKFVSIIQ